MYNEVTWTGVSHVSASTSGFSDTNVLLADMTAASINVDNEGGPGKMTVAGGSELAINAAGAKRFGDIVLIGSALNTVSAMGGANITVDNTAANGATAGGATLHQVKLINFTGSTATVNGAGIKTLHLESIAHDAQVTLANRTAGHALDLHLREVGYASNFLFTRYAVELADATVASMNIDASGQNALTLAAPQLAGITLTGAGNFTLDANAAVTSRLGAIDGSAASGNITLERTGAATATIRTGSGHDNITLAAATVKDDVTTVSIDETVNASVSPGAGINTITLATTGNGKVSFFGATGERPGADNLTIASRSGAESFMLHLGDASDSITAAAGVSINAADIVDGGGGYDTLDLRLVGAANMGAFSGFELLQAAGLNKSIDLAAFSLKNSAHQIAVAGPVGAGVIKNMTAGDPLYGISVYLKADMAGSTLALGSDRTQAGAPISVNVEMHETGAADTAADSASSSLVLSNYGKATIRFNTAFKSNLGGEATQGDNFATLTLSTDTVSNLTIESFGSEVNNVLNYTDTGHRLAALTISGSAPLTLNATASALLHVRALSNAGLIMSTASLADSGTISVGSNRDSITVDASSNVSGLESIAGLSPMAPAALDPAAGAAAIGAAIAGADKLILAGGRLADAAAVAGGAVDAKGVLTFGATRPATLAAAFAIAELAAESNGEVLAFGYLDDTYVFMQGSDAAVRLTGLAGITSLREDGSSDAFFLV